MAQCAEIDANTEGDLEASRMFKSIVKEENPLKFKRMDVEKAVALQVHAGLSRTPWNVVRDGFSDSTSVPCRYLLCNFSVTNSAYLMVKNKNYKNDRIFEYCEIFQIIVWTI